MKSIMVVCAVIGLISAVNIGNAFPLWFSGVACGGCLVVLLLDWRNRYCFKKDGYLDCGNWRIVGHLERRTDKWEQDESWKLKR